MNTRRCELCGSLHGNRSGHVTIGVPRADVDHVTHDHYNLCEACAVKVYDMVEGIKNSDGKLSDKPSATDNLILRQNAEIARMRMCVRNAYNDLFSGMKWLGKNSASAVQMLEERMNSAVEWLNKAEPYEDD